MALSIPCFSKSKFLPKFWDQIGTKQLQTSSVPKVSIETIENKKSLLVEGASRIMMQSKELEKKFFLIPILSVF